MNRVFLTKLHLITAALMFPAVLMFLATGALYTWGSKGDWHEQVVEVPLEQPFAGSSEDLLTRIVTDEFADRGIALPSGKASYGGEGEDVSLSWSGARTEASIEAAGDPLVASLTIREASMHRWLVQLHKAKGSTFFKVYATALAIVLFLLVLSGIIMGLQVKALRKLTITSSLVGVAGFVGFVLLG